MCVLLIVVIWLEVKLGMVIVVEKQLQIEHMRLQQHLITLLKTLNYCLG